MSNKCPDAFPLKKKICENSQRSSLFYCLLITSQWFLKGWTMNVSLEGLFLAASNLTVMAFSILLVEKIPNDTLDSVQLLKLLCLWLIKIAPM